MSVNYIKYRVNDFLHRFYNIKANITDIDSAHTLFDIGYIGSFILNLNTFKSDADITAFALALSERINTFIPANSFVG